MLSTNIKFLCIDTSKGYINSLAEFAEEILKDKNNDKEIYIVLPTFLSVGILKTTLIKNLSKRLKVKKSALLLPHIITIDQYVHQVTPQRAAGNVMNYEQTMIMSSIIKNYPVIKYRASEAIQIASSLIDIYWSLKRNSICYQDIEKWVEEDLAEHWWMTAEFLKYCFEKYDFEIEKYTNIESLKSTFEKKILIFAGLVEQFAKDFEIIKLEEGDEKYMILPHIDENVLTSLHPQKNYSYLARHYKAILARKELALCPEIKNKKQLKFKKYSLEFYDIYEEAEYLFHRIINRGSSIAIITNNQFLEELITLKIKYAKIEYNSSFGNPYTDFKEVEFFLNLAKFKASNGSVASYVALLKSRLLKEKEAIAKYLEKLNKPSKFYENFQHIYNDNYYKDDSVINNLNQILLDWLNYKENNLNNIFIENLYFFESIYNFLELDSEEDEANKFKDFIMVIKNLLNKEYLIDNEEYDEYLIKVFALKYSRPFSKTANVYFLKPEEAYIVDTVETIFADFNQESYLNNAEENIWLNNKILKKLDLINESDQFEKLHYLVTIKATRQDITFTRAKYNEGVILEKCSLLDFLDNIENLNPVIEREKTTTSEIDNFEITTNLFPKILYATNIELLLRDPYGFYGRKILSVRKAKTILSAPENADFGLVAHELIEIVHTTPNEEIDKIIEDIFLRAGIHYSQHLLWADPLKEIGKHILDMNKNIIEQNGRIYSEIEGKTILNISGNNIEIRAIADRIEFLDNVIRIIDFKTGVVPTKKDVSCGKSPQLIIEAIILLEGGFNVTFNNKASIELVYYKVNTKEPYLEETIINFSLDEINMHKEALVNFLCYYYAKDQHYITRDYLPDYWRPNYDDYEHLRRIN